LVAPEKLFSPFLLPHVVIMDVKGVLRTRSRISPPTKDAPLAFSLVFILADMRGRLERRKRKAIDRIQNATITSIRETPLSLITGRSSLF